MSTYANVKFEWYNEDFYEETMNWSMVRKYHDGYSEEIVKDALEFWDNVEICSDDRPDVRPSIASTKWLIYFNSIDEDYMTYRTANGDSAKYTIDLAKEVIRLDHPEDLRSRRNEIDLNEEWSDELRDDVKTREIFDNQFIGWDKEGISGYVKSEDLLVGDTAEFEYEGEEYQIEVREVLDEDQIPDNDMKDYWDVGYATIN